MDGLFVYDLASKSESKTVLGNIYFLPINLGISYSLYK